MSRWNIRPLAIFGTAAVTSLAASMLMASSAANADSVWYQAYERASQDAACAAPADETPWQTSFSGQKEWTPSWQQWANGGKGGWVCQRAIVWAKSTPEGGGTAPASGLFSGCVGVDLNSEDVWFNIVDGYSAGEPYDDDDGNSRFWSTTFADADCSTRKSEDIEDWVNDLVVYAADVDAANDMCIGFSSDYYDMAVSMTNNLFQCGLSD